MASSADAGGAPPQRLPARACERGRPSEDGLSRTGTICQRKIVEATAQAKTPKGRGGLPSPPGARAAAPADRRSASRARPPQGRGRFSRHGAIEEIGRVKLRVPRKRGLTRVRDERPNFQRRFIYARSELASLGQRPPIGANARAPLLGAFASEMAGAKVQARLAGLDCR